MMIMMEYDAADNDGDADDASEDVDADEGTCLPA